jgi:hypothetical protein
MYNLKNKVRPLTYEEHYDYTVKFLLKITEVDRTSCRNDRYHAFNSQIDRNETS